MSNARLAKASSPYLRQHADDPVEWHTWGPEAFAAARERDVPIFLSSGYSASHWCHVMQAESFQDAGTAALLNERFVPVKVDRELRPDVDAVYMDYVVATTGAGGWPMSVFLGPNLAPLAGGTYFPREARGSVPSFTEVLEAVDSAYRDDREGVLRTTEGALHFLREQAAPRVECELDRDALDRDVDYLLHLADQTRGGIGGAPKFPQATLTLFLCAYHALNPDPGVAWVVERTLTGMVRGGIYDQAGGGLHRYAVDTDWRTPHFEKMLYDQGLLLSCLAAGAPLASCEAVRGEYAYVAAQTAAFLRREMLAPAGGFFASLAADTLGVEAPRTRGRSSSSPDSFRGPRWRRRNGGSAWFPGRPSRPPSRARTDAGTTRTSSTRSSPRSLSSGNSVRGRKPTRSWSPRGTPSPRGGSWRREPPSLMRA
jgi:uncharacterized protein YyaL (SSP411 family)